jgi:hypothetical protein
VIGRINSILRSRRPYRKLVNFQSALSFAVSARSLKVLAAVIVS